MLPPRRNQLRVLRLPGQSFLRSQRLWRGRMSVPHFIISDHTKMLSIGAGYRILPLHCTGHPTESQPFHSAPALQWAGHPTEFLPCRTVGHPTAFTTPTWEQCTCITITTSACIYQHIFLYSKLVQHPHIPHQSSFDSLGTIVLLGHHPISSLKIETWETVWWYCKRFILVELLGAKK